ncbi:MAG: Stp1/IreP family PP2C-type Ser/Thr phosphatase [Cellulosilyticaceae bacterium]
MQHVDSSDADISKIEVNSMIAVGKVDVGRRRKCNEDEIFVSNMQIGPLPNLYIIADGMGGHRNGAIASKLAIDAFCMYLEELTSIRLDSDEDIFILLKRAISHANYTIYSKGLENPTYKGMGTTMTLCTLWRDKAYIAHVGDSRVYVVNKTEGIKQITTDHSVVQEMVEKGYISKQEMKDHPQRHMITRAVGTYESVKVDVLTYEIGQDVRLLMCSDGLTTMVTDEMLYEIISQDNQSLEVIADRLIDCANHNGGCDNIAVIIGKQCEVNQIC